MMEKDKKQWLNDYLSKLRIELLHAKLSVCGRDWKRFNYAPSYNKLYYICDGEGWIQFGNEQYTPRPGELMFIPGGVLQSFSVTEGTPYTMYWCHFRSNIQFVHLFNLFDLPKVVKADPSAGLQQHFRQLSDHRANGGPATTLKIYSALFAIIAYFIDQAYEEKDDTPQMMSVRKLLDTIHYIDTHLTQELTIEELAQTAHFHPNYFIRFFKKHLGMPPKRYIYERRLEEAKHLLAFTDLAVNEVACRAGFNDGSYFSAAFKKSVGFSPSEYRNRVSIDERTNP
ncbi:MULTISPECIES: helix-turn-helix domain-containing protein [Paenibacillus]|uniref:Helix-turn-helix domain-containing protein n=1 Tax=Paenibacillus residui TaxID=629724 RepID=A0ABW3DDU3_9BACL